jgi:outer membrane protein assembly factor BamB
MESRDLIFLGIKKRALAIEKHTGRVVWTTQLSGGLGEDFVTLLVDGPTVFAYTKGHLHGLDATTGKILWKNELPGCGYGLASLATQGTAAPDPALIRAIQAARRDSGGD